MPASTSHPPKALLHVPTLGVNDGGPPRSVSALADSMYRNGDDVTLLYGKSEDQGEVSVAPGMTMCPYSRTSGPLSASMSTALGDKDVDLAHDSGIWGPSNLAFYRYAQQRKLPLMISPRGMLEPWAMNHHKWKKKIAWFAYQRKILHAAAGFHATADSEAEQLRKLGFRQPIAVLPNGVNLPAQAASHHEDTTTRTLLFLSRVHVKKGIPLLLEAWSHLRPQNWKLVIAGNDDGGHAAEVVQQIKQLHLEEVAQVVGPLENEAKEAAFLNADAFVLPTYSENFGIVVAEAMSYGLPVLTTTGAPWRMLRDEDCGWWVEPATPEIEKALLQLFACERTRRITMGLKARELVQTHFAWPSIGERMRAFYEHLLFKTSKPDFLYP